MTKPSIGRWKSAAAGVLLAVGAGLFMPKTIGLWLERASFDLSFLVRPEVAITNAVIVYMDEDSAAPEKLNQPWPEWRRDMHARLIHRLVESRARAIVFDVLFDRTNQHDTAFLEAVQTARQQGIPVVVGIKLSQEQRERRAYVAQTETYVDPFAELKSITDWGIAEGPEDLGDTPRRHSQGHGDTPGLARRVAQLIEPDAVRDLPHERWINFYPPARAIPHRLYFAALDRDQVPDSFFANKVCFVGAQARTPFPGGKSTDEWHTPYTRWGHGKMPGVEITAMIYLNLVCHDWLNRLSRPAVLVLVLVGGLGFGLGLTWSRPTLSVALGLLGAFLIFGTACWLMWHRQLWFSWLIPAAVQMPVALGWSILANTRRLSRENRELQQELKQRTKAVPTSTRQEVAPTILTPAPAADGVVPPTTVAGLTRGGSPPGAVATAPPAIPDHTLLRRIGKGAYGEVWLARNVIGTCHAVKFVRASDFEEIAPFEREFRGIQKFMPISRLHPGLVQILHAGRNDAAGFFYYVMEPADDETTGAAIHPDSYSPNSLANELKRRGRLPVAECLRHGLRLTEALEFLHAQRLVHRDIKPSNIIFVRGEAKLADIGLVTDIATPATDASYVGTRGYIPPEGPGQPAADLFSLGRVLYEASMGLPREQFPELPETILDRPDYDFLLRLNQIILHACDDDLTRRYTNASAMHSDLKALHASLTARQ